MSVGDATSLSLVAASCAAALLLQSSPADAKVIFEPVQSKKVQTDLKRKAWHFGFSGFSSADEALGDFGIVYINRLYNALFAIPRSSKGQQSKSSKQPVMPKMLSPLFHLHHPLVCLSSTYPMSPPLCFQTAVTLTQEQLPCQVSNACSQSATLEPCR